MAGSNPLGFVYPEDQTGAAATNKIIGEKQTLNPPVESFDFHFIIPMAAPYFRDTLVITHLATGRVLQRGTDYTPGHAFLSASYELEKIKGGIYGSILFFDKTLSGQVLLQYQTLGGVWTLSNNDILALMSNRATDPRSLSYDEVNGKPTVFPPTEHNHPVDDFTGAAELIIATNDVAAAIRQRTDDWLENPPILFGEYYTRSQIDSKFNGVASKFQLYYTAAEIDVKLHNLELGQGSGDYYTKVEINTLLSQVFGQFNNYYPKVDIDAKIGVLNTRMDGIDSDINTIDDELTAHIANKLNPHGVTPAIIGAVEVAVYEAGQQAVANQMTSLSQTKADKTEVGTNGRRDVYISTAAPTAAVGKVGDIYYQY